MGRSLQVMLEAVKQNVDVPRFRYRYSEDQGQMA